jgi:hypothetical protein
MTMAVSLSPQRFKTLFPNASRSTLEANGAIPHPVAERDEAEPLCTAAQGENQSAPRVIVRFKGYRVRPLDPDNFAGSVKDLLDGLRHAHLIPGDEAWRIKLETEQERVATFAEERTEIEIEWP